MVLRGRIGDLMCTWPLLAWIKKHTPHCRIHLFGEPIHRELIPLIAPIDRLWVFPMNHTQYREGWKYGAQWRGQYDAAIAAHTRPRSWVAWFLKAMAAQRQIAFVDKRRRFGHIHQTRPWTAEYEEAHHETYKLFQLVDPSCTQVPEWTRPRIQLAEKMELDFGGDLPLVCVSISSNRKSCKLKLETWARCLNALHDVRVAVSFVERDRREAEQLVSLLKHPARAVTTPSLRDLLRLLNSSQLVATGEGGVSHLTAALDKPQVVLFGETSPIQWAPQTERAAILSDPHDVNRIDPAHIEAALKGSLV